METLPNPPGEGEPRDGQWSKKRDQQRGRQLCIRAILESAFGPLAESDPRLWDKRAYQMLVGLLYERLATNGEELSTSDLTRLAKALVEVRRSRSCGKKGRPSILGKAHPGPLPYPLRGLIKDIYGVEPDLSSTTTPMPDQPAGPDLA